MHKCIWAVAFLSVSLWAPSAQAEEALPPCSGSLPAVPYKPAERVNFANITLGQTGTAPVGSGVLAAGSPHNQNLKALFSGHAQLPQALSQMSKVQDALNGAAHTDTVSLNTELQRRIEEAAALPLAQQRDAVLHHLKVIEGKATVSALQRRLDPNIVQAYTSKPLPELTDIDFASLPSEAWARALRVKSVISTPRLGATANIGKGSVESVGSGTEGPYGGFGGAPPNQPMIVAHTATGAPCHAPAQLSDGRLDPITSKVGYMWDRKGFQDVGMLLWRQRTDRDNIGICTFIRVGVRYALTAAHCVVDSARGAPVVVKD